VLFAVVFGSGTAVAVAATASRACAPGSKKTSRGIIGLALQTVVRVKAPAIRIEALIWGRMFVFGLEYVANDDGDNDVEYWY
jgi:hypothetical protein